MKFRKKPVVIDAFQWHGDFDAIDAWLNSLGYQEDGEDDGAADGIHESDTEEHVLVIPTEEGEHRAMAGDWIIRGIKGEFYPCKPDIFAATYEPAGAAAETPAASVPLVTGSQPEIDWSFVDKAMAVVSLAAIQAPMQGGYKPEWAVDIIRDVLKTLRRPSLPIATAGGDASLAPPSPPKDPSCA